MGIEVAKLMLKYDGVIDVNSMLKFIVNWFKERKWDIDKESAKHKAGEIEYEFIFKIQETDYIEDVIKVWFVIKDIKKFNEKEKGRMLMEIIADLNADWQEAFKTSRFWKKFQVFYHKFIYGRELMDYWGDKLYYTAHKLQGDIKEFLDMVAKSNVYKDMY